jgi:hypothetical protein
VNEHDFEEFADAFGAAWDFHKPLSDRALAKAFQVLSRYPLPVVIAAIDAHCSDRDRGQFPPKPADIIFQIERRNPDNQRPGPDEAWARMPRSEDDSVVWTEEMAYAWGVASPMVNPCMVDRPDWIAARMAFRDAYTRACDAAKAQCKPVRWFVARGHRKDNLEDVLNEAMRLGYISGDDAKPHLAELEHVRPVNQQLLLEGAKESPEAVRETAMEAVAKLRKMLTPDPAAIEAAREEAKRYCEAKDRQRERHGRADAA